MIDTEFLNEKLAKKTLKKIITQGRTLGADLLSLNTLTYELQLINTKKDQILATFLIPTVSQKTITAYLKNEPACQKIYNGKKIIKLLKSLSHTKPEKSSIVNLKVDHNNLSPIFDLMTKGHGFLTISAKEATTAHGLVNDLLNSFAADKYHRLVFAPTSFVNAKNNSHFRTDHVSQTALTAGLKNIKNYDADIIYLELNFLPNSLSELINLSDQKLIILFIPSPSAHNALKQLCQHLEWDKNLLAKHSLHLHLVDVPEICTNCSTKLTLNNLLTKDLASELGLPSNLLSHANLRYGAGCPDCHHTGLGEQLVLAELVDLNHQPITKYTARTLKDFFLDPPHTTWQELLVKLTLTGEVDIERTKKLI